MLSRYVPVNQKIILSNLTEGVHTLYIIGSDEAGNWQAEDDAAIVTWEVQIVKAGDVNRDGVIDLEDVILILQFLSGPEQTAQIYEEADVNGDGKVGLTE